MGNFSHQPVMLAQSLRTLKIENGKKYIDCNLGLGGHSEALLQSGAFVLGIEADVQSLNLAQARLGRFSQRMVLVRSNFANLKQIAAEHSFDQVDGILFDLGLCSRQLDEGSGGFSFRIDAPLDMRFAPQDSALTAQEVINTYSEEKLADIFFKFGGEKRSFRIAKSIVAQRPFYSTAPLANTIAQASGYLGGKIHPATRVFQALRIVVNSELENLRVGLGAAVELLKVGGRLVVLTYHSLEDRITKEIMNYQGASCICPPRLPICCCHKQKTVLVLPKEVPTPEEIKQNPRARSAKMRACEKLKINQN